MHLHPQALCESDQVGEGTRIWAFAHVMRGAVVGAHCNIGEGAFIEAGAVVGDRVTLKNQVLVWDGVTIADDAFVGPGVIFTNDAHPRSPRMPQVEDRYRDPANWRRPTRVERGATIGAGAIILPGLTIGAFAMVGAGAVVIRDVKPQQIVAGNPAKPHGWVCVCAGGLDDDLTCALCRAAYRWEGDQLVSREPPHV
jgi:UDP-2-acetamido-3-amino-2,3-dideoxy-glucuronate N-acetyltransferase